MAGVCSVQFCVRLATLYLKVRSTRELDEGEGKYKVKKIIITNSGRVYVTFKMEAKCMMGKISRLRVVSGGRSVRKIAWPTLLKRNLRLLVSSRAANNNSKFRTAQYTLLVLNTTPLNVQVNNGNLFRSTAIIRPLRHR